MQTHVTLPKWLDDYIFNELGAKYCRSNSDMMVINWDKSDILNYLGTYFPRSYAESYCIFSHYFASHQDEWNEKTTLSVFDFGCGTGGEIIGLFQAINESLPNTKEVYVTAFDGNYHALRLLESICQEYKNALNFKIILRVFPHRIDDFYDLEMVEKVITKRFDIAMSFKAICEFVTKDQFERKNAYEHISNFLLSKLKENGIILLVDVTTYNNTSEEWLPKMIDSGLTRTSCCILERNEGFNMSFTVRHSRMQIDKSKIAYRIIKHK